jgi:hypothetical protein
MLDKDASILFLFVNLLGEILDNLPDAIHLQRCSYDDLKTAATIIGTAKFSCQQLPQCVHQCNQAPARACQISHISHLRGVIGKPCVVICQMNGSPPCGTIVDRIVNVRFQDSGTHLKPHHVHQMADAWNVDAAKVPNRNEAT